MSEVIRAIASVGVLGADDLIRGVAWRLAPANIDRMKRAFLPGAFGSAAFKVPLLAFHDETRPVGSSKMLPDASHLRHESSIVASTDAGREARELVKAGALPYTSLGWLDVKSYTGDDRTGRDEWNVAGVTYYEKADVVENSLVPVPANPQAIIATASLFSHDSDLDQAAEAWREMAAGARHNQADQKALQAAHDAIIAAGAMCAPEKAALFQRRIAQMAFPEALQSIDANIDEALNQLSGGNADQARALLQAADELMDTLLDSLGIPDADETPADEADDSLFVDSQTPMASLRRRARLDVDLTEFLVRH